VAVSRTREGRPSSKQHHSRTKLAWMAMTAGLRPTRMVTVDGAASAGLPGKTDAQGKARRLPGGDSCCIFAQ
jgi:hypothetical protein